MNWLHFYQVGCLIAGPYGLLRVADIQDKLTVRDIFHMLVWSLTSWFCVLVLLYTADWDSLLNIVVWKKGPQQLPPPADDMYPPVVLTEGKVRRACSVLPKPRTPRPSSPPKAQR